MDRQRRSKGEEIGSRGERGFNYSAITARLVCPLDSVSRVCRIYVSEEVVCYTGGGGL